LVAAAREVGADFIYERYAFGCAAGVQAARRVGLPLVLEVNSPMVLELSKTRGLSFPGTAARLETHVFQSADRVCVVTAVLGEMLVGMGVERERLVVTPNGVHLEQYRPGDEAARAAARADLGLAWLEPDAVVLGFVGYYRRWHRLDLVVAALARPELARAVLVLVGEGPARAELSEAAARHGVERRVLFAGSRPHDAIPALLAAFDVALVPAINPYASPLKLFEYMAAGLAVVAPDQPNLREVLADGANALLVPAEDGAALAAALMRLVGQPELRERLGRAARRTLVERDLTWRANARRVVAAVESLP
jgi:glycosyltransferase involved in cell wall biosynthesis